MRSRRVFFFVVFISIALPVFAYDWSTNPGDGSAENPYQISEPNHLIAINDLDTAGKHFVLMNDIDLDPDLPQNRVFDSFAIGTMAGTFDGREYSIRNLTIWDDRGEPGDYGLFALITESGFVKNLQLRDVSICIIACCTTTAGALAAKNDGIVINCHSSGFIENDGCVGGLIGRNGNWDKTFPLIINSTSACLISGMAMDCKGGFTAYNYGSIFQCSFTGSIQAEMMGVGGLIGYNEGVVNRCFSKVQITADSVGGLIYENRGRILNSFSVGTLSSQMYFELGGLVCSNYTYQYHRSARVENCYAAVATQSGGLIGSCWEQGAELASFWDTDISGTTTSEGGKGLHTWQMKDPNTFIDAGWDFAGESANGSEDIWQIDPNSNGGYPSLVVKPIDGGDGSAERPFVIYTKQHLLDFFSTPALWDKHILLIANIDLAGHSFRSVPVKTFSGVFDGGHCTISGLTINSGSTGALGLFDVVNRSGIVKNLHIENASMTGYYGGILASLNLGQIRDCHIQGSLDGFECGGVVAFNEGVISRCSADCTVDSWDIAGGLVGLNSYLGFIEESCSYGSIESSNYGGGLVGWNWGKIQHSYSTAEVLGDYNGALVGSNELGVIICCYATGPAANNELVGFSCGVGAIAHSCYGNVTWPAPWEGNSWYAEDGHIWTLDVNYNDQPLLKWQRWGRPVTAQACGYTPFYRMDPQRDGSKDRPYIFDPELADFPADWDKHFVMNEDIDRAFCGILTESAIPYFNGILQGNGHVIKNVQMQNRSDYGKAIGFFGMLGPDAQVRQLGIEGQVDYFSIFPAIFAATNFGTLEECYAKGSVTCSSYGGLLTGFNGGTIRSCYAEGTLTLEEDNSDGTLYTEIVGGGLYARNWGRVLNSYSSVSAIYLTDYIYSGVGGLNESLVWNSFWNKSLTDPNFILGGKPLTDAQMKDPNSFGGWGDGIWKMAPGFDTPRLAWEDTDWQPDSGIPWEEWPTYVSIVDAPRSYGGGNGTVQSPYVLASVEHLLTLGKHLSDSDKHFILGNDIDLGGTIYSESLIGYFEGHFNGAGRRIENLNIVSFSHQTSPYHHHVHTSGIGFFGCIDSGAVVENLAVENAYIDGMCTVGALAGENNGRIGRCYATGQVKARGNAGGLVGTNGFRRGDTCASIEGCYTDVNMHGEALQGFAVKYLGSVAGANGGDIRNCYSTGSLLVDDFMPHYTPFIAGGIAGWSAGGVENSFYLEGYTTYTYGQPLTAEQLKQRASFTGWDFLGESANGNNEIWRMCADGVDYPRLSWEFARNGDFACGDGVDLLDLLALAEHWLQTEAAAPATFNYACDANSDAIINIADLAALSANWP